MAGSLANSMAYSSFVPMKHPITLRAEDLERLMDIAARSNAVNDAPTLTLLAEVCVLIGKARRRC